MSSVNTKKFDQSVYAAAKGLINGSSIKSLSLSGSGANSRIYRVETSKDIYALKFYREGKRDYNDRLNAEKKALNLFHNNGILNTPEIYGFDLENNCVLMEWVDGSVIRKPNSRDIDSLSDFIINIDQVKNSINLESHVEATEACLSASELISQIENRIDKLSDSDSQDLHDFIKYYLSPLFEEISYWVCDCYINMNMNTDEKLRIEYQTLSVVDFGFHNALKKRNDDIIFIDFEYFGLDDPVKLVSDTLLHPHPLMNISRELRQYFFDKTIGCFSKDDNYYDRMKVLYPLYALRWCTIMLNPFLPDYTFVDSNSNRVESMINIQGKRLSDVRKIIINLSKDYSIFPF